jgi:hypothetical protein
MMIEIMIKKTVNKNTNNKIGSIRTFLGCLEKLEEPFDFVYYFRSHSDCKFNIEPSIYREKQWINNEHKMYREIITKCPNDFNQTNSAFEKLVKMQHYSLPTRLLDITENPLIALFFAVNDNIDKDAKVLIFKVPKNKIKYYDSDTFGINETTMFPEIDSVSKYIKEKKLK